MHVWWHQRFTFFCIQWTCMLIELWAWNVHFLSAQISLFLWFCSLISMVFDRIVICVNSFQQIQRIKSNVETMSTTLHATLYNQCTFNTNKQQNNHLQSSACPNSDWNVLFWTGIKAICLCMRLISFLLNYCWAMWCSKRKRKKEIHQIFSYKKNGSIRSFLYLCCGLKNPTFNPHPYSHTNEKK